MEWSEYLPILQKIVDRNSLKIKQDISKFINSKKIYRNISYSDFFSLILIREKDADTTLNVGYPFPMLSKKIKYQGVTDKQVSIKFFLRGKPIREKQRINLISELGENNLFEFIEVKKMKDFRNLTKKICKKYDSFDYFDPYTFVGDSFIGMYLVDNFKEIFGLKLKKVYSNSSPHLAFSFDSSKFNSNKIESCSGLCIVGDFIDMHWNRTVPLIKKLLKKNKSIIILGRNLVTERENGGVKIYHLSFEDHLLRNQNIEDYMKSIIRPHLIPKEIPQKVRKMDKLNILINPFGSEEIKTIPKDFIVSFTKNVLRFSPDSKIIIVKGFNFLEHHKNWVNEIKIELDKEGLSSNIELKSYNSLSDIVKDIEKDNITLGLTSDTSISHLFNFMGVINLSFFNSDRWDNESIQSLSSDSPLGFCRYYATEIPIIFNHRDYNFLLKDIINLIKLIKSKRVKLNAKKLESLILELCNKKDLDKINNSIKNVYLTELNKTKLSWLNNLFNPMEILDKINLNDDSKFLFYSAWRLNILNKLGELK
ncbi:MAG: hypothetical protein PHC28_12970 [Flavobacterium sp.]|uniref:hypothetical protein n=1 Tax=Flavobacterium sp. TaxID=239 RepID=UPI002609D48A|nr:hypothetical protein [Flavobacterium sp.]MDD5151363.1 hypothetical protein [Flavobacterium sp.]